jgi:hypothetical protein
MKRLALLLLIALICFHVTFPAHVFAVFSASDLAGTWHFFNFFDHPSLNIPGWSGGTVTFNSSGAVTGGSIVNSDGVAVAVAGGSGSLSSTGIFSGFITAGGITSTISQGKMDSSKTIAAFVGIDGQGFRFTGTAIKAGGTFSTSDLAGTWHFFNFFDHPSLNIPGWNGGTLTINSSGTVTGGTIVDSDGFSATVTGGSVSLDGSGLFFGFITITGATLTISQGQGKMDAGKTLAAFVGVSSQGFRFTGTAIKAETPSPLVAAILPSSRSVQVGTAATAFATIINTDQGTATACSVAPITIIPANFVYQTTNPATNQITGMPNTPVNIGPGAAQSFVFAFTPTSSITPTDVRLSFDCANTNPAPINIGLNTLLLSASAAPVPDIVALAATLGNDGVVILASAGVFSVATVNVGASGAITASVDTGTAILPVNISLCQTDPATGQCISGIGPSVTTQINANTTPTFGIFVQGNGNVSFDPAANRIFVRFRDAGGVTRGSTSVAVRTDTGLEAFAGTYSGTFSGDDSGTWTAIVDSTGNVTGSGAASAAGNFHISGNVTRSGAISFTAGTVTAGANFSGTISFSGEVTGNWANVIFSASGTFSGRRQ